MRRLLSFIRLLALLALPAIVIFAIYDMHYSNETMDVSVAPHHDDRPTPYFIQMGPERVLMCNTSFHDKRGITESNLPVIYFITPTHTQSIQLPDLTRLGQTLAHVPALHWIVAEDSYSCSPIVGTLLQRLGIPYTHMATPMPEKYRKKKNLPRGVANRRGGLEWIRRNAAPSGVLYFGDDDNTYDLRLFDEIRSTNYVSMFPVGLIGKYSVSSPVCQEGKLVGFYDAWVAGRKYVIDMAGFAVNVNVLRQNPNASMPYLMGYEEDGFLRSLNLDMAKIEPKANNCSEVLVWHTKTLKTSTVDINPPVALANKDSLDPLLKRMQQISLIKFNTTVDQSKAVPLKAPVVVMKAKKKFFKPIAKRAKRRA